MKKCLTPKKSDFAKMCNGDEKKIKADSRLTYMCDSRPVRPSDKDRVTR